MLGLCDLSYRPDEASQLTCDSCTGFVLMQAPITKFPVPMTQPDLRFPGDLSNSLRKTVEALLDLPTDFCWMPIIPCRLNQ